MSSLSVVLVGVVANGSKHDLLNTLSSRKIKGHTTWKTTYRVRRPGIYVFYMEPQPYWEPVEDSYIVHYTKTTVESGN